MSQLRDYPEIFYAPRGHIGRGAWIPTRAHIIREAFQDAARFSSHQNAGFSAMFGEDWPLIPLEIDPPEHMKWRKLLNPLFTPAGVQKMEGKVRSRTVDLIQKIRDNGGCEFQKEFGGPFPISIFMELVGLPMDLFDAFLSMEDGLLRGDAQTQAQCAKDIRDFMVEFINERSQNPQDDLASFIVNSQLDGRPLTIDEKQGVLFLLFVAGLDTVASALGFLFRELALDQKLQARVRAQPEIRANLIEEILRARTGIASGRCATQDMVFHGVQIKAGDRFALSTVLANLDEEDFTNPLTINLDRQINRHMAFAVGPHRCLGSHLARRELRIALDEWLERIPQFRIKDGECPKCFPGPVLSVTHLPLVW